MKCALGFALPPHRQKCMTGSGAADFVSEYFQQVENSLEVCRVRQRDCHTRNHHLISLDTQVPLNLLTVSKDIKVN